jgi:DNA-binding transcriptional ArsR family regulator
MQNLLWYLIAGTKGGETRGKIVSMLNSTPSNANKIAETLKYDYKTIRHHLHVLEKNNIITAVNKDTYGSVYFLSENMKENYKLFGDIWAKFGKK